MRVAVAGAGIVAMLFLSRDARAAVVPVLCMFVRCGTPGTRTGFCSCGAAGWMVWCGLVVVEGWGETVLEDGRACV